MLMGAFDKFRSADKLFWESSGVIIDKITNTYINTKSQYIKTLSRYYFKYSIDIFDDENISKLFDFYPLVYNLKTGVYDDFKTGVYDDFKTRVYDDLKEIQKNSTDYVTDYCSYEDRLKAYYDIHGEDTKWLVKIFAERYDLDRFNITPEDVLDDLHKIMTTTPQIPSLKKNNSSALNILSKNTNETVFPTYKKEGTRTSSTQKSTSSTATKSVSGTFKSIDENTLFNEVKTMPVKFDYTAALTGKYQDINDISSVISNKDINNICSALMSNEYIKSSVSDDAIMTIEQIIQKKRLRSPRKADYDKIMEDNILFEIYRYSYLMNTIAALEKHKDDDVDVDFPSYWSMIQNDCRARMKNLEQEKRNNPAINACLGKYASDNRMVSMRMLSQINGRENDYVITGLMTDVLMTMLYLMFNGAAIQFDNSSPQQKIMQIITKYPSKEVCMVIDTYIVNMVVMRTSIYANGGSPLSWN